MLRDVLRESEGLDCDDVEHDALDRYWSAIGSPWTDSGDGPTIRAIDVERAMREESAPEPLEALPGARWIEELRGEDGDVDPVALDRFHAACDRAACERAIDGAARWKGHAVAWRETHPARSVGTCAGCGVSVVVNVRPCLGAARQERFRAGAFGGYCAAGWRTV